MKAINFTEDFNEVVTYRAFAEDDGISKPTAEQYEESKKRCRDFADWIRRSKKRQDELLDELCKERVAEKDYQNMYTVNKDLVRRYELYSEIEAELQ
jgi:hypothetical protein